MRTVVCTTDFQFNPPTRLYTEMFRAGITYTEVSEPAAAAIVAAGAGYVPGATRLEERARVISARETNE